MSNFFTSHPQNLTVLFGDFADFSCSTPYCSSTLVFRINNKTLQGRFDERVYNESDIHSDCDHDTQQGEVILHMSILINNTTLHFINANTSFSVTCHLIINNNNIVSEMGFVEIEYPCKLCDATCNKSESINTTSSLSSCPAPESSGTRITSGVTMSSTSTQSNSASSNRQLLFSPIILLMCIIIN